MAADRHRLVRVAACAALAGCAAQTRPHHDAACGADEQAWIHDTLYLGTSRAHGGAVEPAQWQRFEHDVLLATFPDGFTVLHGDGHWRDKAAKDFDEPVRVLVVDHPDDATRDAAVQSVIADYCHRFDQEAVLRERSRVCVSFNDKN